MRNTKLLKVMDYLINEQEDKARELLHQIFIEKARAIHESMIHDEMDEDDEVLGGNEGRGLAHEIEDNKNKIVDEEHYGDGTMEDIDLDDAVDDLSDDDQDEDDDMMSHDEDDDDMIDDEDEDEVVMSDDEEDEEEDDEDERIHDLEQAIEDLKAEFDAIKHNEEHGSEHDSEDEHDEDEHEEEVDENWMQDDLDESFDDLDESLELEEVPVNMKKSGEVGSGKFSRTEVNTKSPVASNRVSLNGAEPVKIRSKDANGFARQSAPSSTEMKGASSNRRKKASDGMSTVSKEGNSRALLNKDRSEGFGAQNTKSPLGSTGTTPRK